MANIFLGTKDPKNKQKLNIQKNFYDSNSITEFGFFFPKEEEGKVEKMVFFRELCITYASERFLISVI